MSAPKEQNTELFSNRYTRALMNLREELERKRFCYFINESENSPVTLKGQQIQALQIGRESC